MDVEANQKLLLSRLRSLRDRLLDLSNRNRLVSFKHSPRARTHIRAIDELPDELFAKLSDGKRLRFRSLPEPESEPPDEDSEQFLTELEAARVTDPEYREALRHLQEGEADSDKAAEIERSLRDRVRVRLGMPPWVDEASLSIEEFARRQGLEPSYDLPIPQGDGEDPDRHIDDEIQTLLYPREMDRKLSGIVDQARTMMQETGISTLRAAFGFLEWREFDKSDKTRLSPLLLLPVRIERRVSRPWRRYDLFGDGNEIEQNKTLAMRLDKDFGFDLPSFAEDDTPERYLHKVADAVALRQGWRVRRFVTIGNFGFSKLAMYEDLDPENWPSSESLPDKSVIKDLLLGTPEPDDVTTVSPPDYPIDSPEFDRKAPLLVTDADASQHSAILDACNGKNLVIKGPPGTGKSQTITNIIAASLAQKWRVLFVAEKMAALDVVYARLKEAGLAKFCLEAHSNNVSKVSLLKSLQSRLDLQGQLPEAKSLESKLEELRHFRDRLNEYVATLQEKVGNLGTTVHDVLWGEQRWKLETGDACPVLEEIFVDPAKEITVAELNANCHAIEETFTLIEAMTDDGRTLAGHPWAWCTNPSLNPFEIEDALSSAGRWLSALDDLAKLQHSLGEKFVASLGVTTEDLCLLVDGVGHLPAVPDAMTLSLAEALLTNDLVPSLEALLKTLSSESEDAGDGCAVFESGDIPSIKPWSELCDEIVAALDTIKRTAPHVTSLNDTAAFLSDMRESIALLVAAARAAQETHKAADISVALGAQSLRAAFCALKLIRDVSSEALVRRDEKILDYSAGEVISEASQKAKILNQKRADMEPLFRLHPNPGLLEVARHAGALSNAGAFGFLSSEIREAKRFYRAIGKPGARGSTKAMASNLARLADYLSLEDKFTSDAGLRAICGSWFDGATTKFEPLLEIHAWGQRVRQSFPSSGQEAVALRQLLLEGSMETLGELIALAHGLDLEGAEQALQNLPQVDEDVHESIRRASHSGNEFAEACETLTNFRIKSDVEFSKLFDDANCLRDLEPLRAAAVDHSEDNTAEHSEGSISADLLRSCREYVQSLIGVQLPTVIEARLCAQDAKAMADWLRTWALETRESLDRGKSEQDRIEQLVGIATDRFRVSSVSDSTQDDPTFVGGGSANVGGESADPIPFATSSRTTPITLLISRLKKALDDPKALPEWSKFLRSKAQIEDIGFSDFFPRLAERKAHATTAVAAYKWLVYRSLVREAYNRHPHLNDFTGLTIGQARAKFQALDREIIQLQRKQLQAQLCRNSIPGGNAMGLKSSYTELSLIRNELAKKKRHIAPRDLLRRAGKAAQALKPCFMMSPLSVATYLQAGSLSFDLVVMDEASQMPPEDAIGAIARSSQCIIVGDEEQLPPTSFFRRFEDAIEEDEEGGESPDEESILTLGSNVFFPPRQLRWHYRSRHQSLIAFSNKHFYNDSLTVFPSHVEEHEHYGVKAVLVEGVYRESHNTAEVQEIAAWAIDFMRERPEKSLGIVAVNQLQRELIRDEMERLFLSNRTAEEYRRRWDGSLFPFFVKNLENVQGDERDVIAISTVYGPNADGKVAQNFGPISQANGHRRLNVLFTRAREQVVLFTSLRPEHIQIRDTTARGPRILKNYLEYAIDGRLDSGSITDRPPDSDFEVAVTNRIRGLGYEAVPQVGVAGFYIDIGIRHPEFPEIFLLGVECDGATYHSAKSARDRDRLREEVLLGLGWTLYRVWSTDWFSDPDSETEKLGATIERVAQERRDKIIRKLEVRPIEERDDIEVGDEEFELTDTETPPDDSEPAQFAEGFEAEIEAGTMQDVLQSDRVPELKIVEIGDTVTFHFSDNPDQKRVITIVVGNFDPEAGTIGLRTPLGSALLEAEVGDEVEFTSGGRLRTAVVDAIEKWGTPRRDTKPEPRIEPTPQDSGFSGGFGGPKGERDQRDQRVTGLRHPDQGTKSSDEDHEYRAWTSTQVPDPRSANRAEIVPHLKEIIVVEGPIRVSRAYHLYARGCGINRVGRAVRSSLNKALHYLMERGEIDVELEGADASRLSGVARVRGTPPVVVRSRGERDFWEIPPSEVAAVMAEECRFDPRASDEEVDRAVLSRYEVARLTNNIRSELARIRREFLDRT